MATKQFHEYITMSFENKDTRMTWDEARLYAFSKGWRLATQKEIENKNRYNPAKRYWTDKPFTYTIKQTVKIGRKNQEQWVIETCDETQRMAVLFVEEFKQFEHAA